jgi:pimeloyl-ACP methyl ester carboxylesterase
MKKIISKFLGFYLNALAIVAPRKAGLLGFKLFCYPYRIKITGRQHQFLQTAHPITLDHQGEKIRVYRWGNGPKNILLLHGWQSHSYRWKSYVEALDKSLYTIYAFDAPGHGLSSGKFLSVPLYSEVIQKVIGHIGNVHTVVGHSLGSFTALYTFYTNPEMLPDKLIATATPGNAREFFNFYKLQLGISATCMKLVIQRFEKEIHHSPDYFSAPAFAKHLTIPGLLIHDEEDTETSVENSLAIHQAWKNSALIITKGKAHNLKSVDVVNQVVNFIQQEPVSQYTLKR